MSFWSSERFRRRGAIEPLVVPFDARRVTHGAYELTVGPEVSITSKDARTTKEKLDPGGAVTIPPGQFGLVLTEEIVQAPLDAIGFISIRASIKFDGLVNVSGFHVDPGFVGRLKFSVYNAGSRKIVLSRGQRVFMLWFADLDAPTSDGYGGQREGQNEITSGDMMRMQGEVASPAQLQKEIVDLGHSVTNLKWMVGVFVTAVLALIVAVLRGSGSPPVIVVPVQNQQPGRQESATTPSTETSREVPRGEPGGGTPVPHSTETQREKPKKTAEGQSK